MNKMMYRYREKKNFFDLNLIFFDSIPSICKQSNFFPASKNIFETFHSWVVIFQLYITSIHIEQQQQQQKY